MTVAYTDLASVRVYLPDETTYPDDDVEAAITQMKEWVDGFMEIDDYFSDSGQIDDYENGSGASILLLRNEMRPLLAFTNIAISEEDMTTDSLANIRYDSNIHGLYDIYGACSFPKGFNNIKITASFGYSSTPTPIKNAVTKAVVRVLRAGGIASYSESTDTSAKIEQVRIEDAVVRFGSQASATKSVLTTGDDELDSILYRYKFPFVEAALI